MLGNDIAARTAFLNDSSTGLVATGPPATPTSQVPAGVLSSPVTAGITLGSTAFVAIIAASMYAWGRHRGKKAQSRPEAATGGIPKPTTAAPAWNELPECGTRSPRGYASPTVTQMVGNPGRLDPDELYFY